MKKLLALVLCVMLIVSVIPTSAFAATPTSQAMAKAYEKRDELAGRLTQFGIVSIGTTLYKGFLKIKGVTADDVAALKDKIVAIGEANSWDQIAAAVGSDDLSYKGIFKGFGPVIYQAWDNAGGAFITTNTIPAIQKEINKVSTNTGNLLASIA